MKSRFVAMPFALIVLAACSSAREDDVAVTANPVLAAPERPQKDLFCPQQPVTRRDMAYFLERMKRGRDFVPPAGANLFDDVRDASTDERWIEQLFHDGITKGCGDRRYCPDESVPREQMAAFIIRLTHGPDFYREGSGRFADVVDGSKIFEGYIEQLADDGITKGCDANHFCPRQTVSREQMAAFLMRALHKGSPDPEGTNRFGDANLGSPGLAGRTEQAVAEGIMEPCARAEHTKNPEPPPGMDWSWKQRSCEFICNAAAISACGLIEEVPGVGPICALAADKILCPDLCTAGNWRQICFVSDPDWGCTTCCQDIYGCHESCAWGPH